MLLKSIEINGFKSFAKKSELIFTSPISAIVGPNGSGKSNVAEAFRFVLGEQSIKSLRGKRGEDLIWNGSNEFPRSGRASVKVVFDNRNKFLPIDFAEVSIERLVHRDGLNEYFLNGSKVRLKDITELLFSAHIGSSGHHIISQGEADRILNASLTERREIIEEALGLKVYQYKKTESQRKLIKTKENIKQVESLRREIAPHIKFLKKQVEKIEKAEEIRKDLVLKSREYLSIESYFLKTEKEKVNQIKKPLLDSLKMIREDVLMAKKILESDKKDDKIKDLLISVEEKLELVRNKKDMCLRQIGEVDGEIASISRMIKKHEDYAKNNEWKMVELRVVRDLAKEVEDNILSIEKANTIDDVRKYANTIRSIFSAFIEMHEDRVDNQVLVESKMELQKLTEKKVNLLKDKNNTDLEEKNFVLEYQNLQKQIETEKDVNRDAEKNLFRAMADEQSVLIQIKDIESKENILNVREENFKRDSQELISILGQDLLSLDKNIIGVDFSLQDERRRAIEKLKIRFEETGASLGSDVMKEFNDVKTRDEFLEKELEDLSNGAKSLEDLIDELEEKLRAEFQKGLDKINKQFNHFFSLMFGGGQASLNVISKNKNKKSEINEGDIEENILLDEVQNTEDERGIDIDVYLPRKKVKGLIQLSGGERALTSIALIFAMSSVNPPPFIILDETDAALDEANSRKYGDMIENLSKFSELIVITHNRETMSRAGVLYGITMSSGGASKILSVAFEEAVVVAK